MTDKLVELIAKYFEKLNPNSNYIIATQLAGYLRNNGVTFADVPDTNVGKWIPVSERKPSGVDDVLVYAGYADGWFVMRGWYYPEVDEWHVNVWAGVRTGLIVTHWMPMPEPPKEGE